MSSFKPFKPTTGETYCVIYPGAESSQMEIIGPTSYLLPKYSGGIGIRCPLKGGREKQKGLTSSKGFRNPAEKILVSKIINLATTLAFSM